jgi:hypothetical protein
VHNISSWLQEYVNEAEMSGFVVGVFDEIYHEELV